jgi:hypothetical protein
VDPIVLGVISSGNHLQEIMTALIISENIVPDNGGHPSEYPDPLVEAMVSLFLESTNSAVM